MAGLNTIFAAGERQLLRQLEAANAAAVMSSLRLAKQQRVLAPVDDPSAFLTLARFQADLNVVGATMNNVTAAESLLSQTQSTLGQIRAQVEAIYDHLVADEDRTLTPDQRAAAQSAIDSAVAQIQSLAGSTIDGRRMLDGSADYVVSGRNAAQVRALQIHSTLGNGPVAAATKAELSYTGNHRYAAAAANITVLGNRGSATLAIAATDTLESIAERINEKTTSTGVVASVSDNTLKLTSQTAGSSARVQVRVNAGTFLTHGSIYGSGAQTGATPALSGQVLTAATQATLRYTGSGGQTTAAATFSLSGALGASTISVANGENLSSVAEKVNNVSHKTGVTASVDGSTLTLQSVGYGSKATAAVAVSSGTFLVTGGNEDGTANGTNAVAEINGYLLAGDTPATGAVLRHRETSASIAHSATIKLTGHLGSATFTIDTVAHTNDTLSTLAVAINARTADTGVRASVDQYDMVLTTTRTGAETTLLLETTSGTFDTVTGYSAGRASATGTDATTGIPTIQGNRFNINQNGFHYDLEFAAGFSGVFDSMTVTGGPLVMALSTDVSNRSKLAIPSLYPSMLGGLSGTLDQIATGGDYAGLDGNTSRALRIVEETLGQLDRVDGLVDGFYDASIQSSSDLLTELQTKLEDAAAETDGFDAEAEEANLAYQQQLASNATAGLAILHQQRQALVDMIKHIAGLD